MNPHTFDEPVDFDKNLKKMYTETQGFMKKLEDERVVKLLAKCVNSGKYVNTLELPKMKNVNKRYLIRIIHK